MKTEEFLHPAQLFTLHSPLFTLSTCVLAALAYGLVLPLYPTDVFTNLRLGQVALERREIPLQPFLAHSPVEPTAINAAWLAQVLFALVFEVTGFPGLILLQALLMASAFALLMVACLQRSGRALPASAAAVAALVISLPALSLRPQLFSVVLFPLFLLFLSRPRGRWTLIALPLLTALWANLHGGFVLGLLLVAATAVGTHLDSGGRRTPKAALLLPLSLVAACLNPYGPAVYTYALSVSSNPIVRAHVTEWQAPTLAAQSGWLLLASVALVGAALALGRPRVRPTELVLLAGFGAMALQAERNAIWWAMVTAPLLAAAVACVTRGAAPRPATHAQVLRRGAMLLTVVAMLAVLLPWWRETNPLLPQANRGLLAAETPVAAAERLAHSPGSGRLFNPMRWGGYLSWALWPRYQVFGDNMVEAYPPEVWDDYVAISAARPSWQELLDARGVEHAVLDRTSQPRLIAAMEFSPEWRRVHADDGAVVFTRQNIVTSTR